jgi:hypothetical protein
MDAACDEEGWDGSVAIGVRAYASAGWGAFSAGPEIDAKWTFKVDEEPTPSVSAKIGHGKGSGARVEAYVHAEGSFTLLVPLS